MTLSITSYDSPVGCLRLVATVDALSAVLWPHQKTPVEAVNDAQHPVLRRAAAELDEYFAGTRNTFTMPLLPLGTAFQRRVWDELARIPYGQTRSYGDIARALRQPTATRAVGAANGRNPLPLFIPCHRVIGSDGSLTGFAGGHEAKHWLLAMEGQRTPAPLFAELAAPGV